MILEPENNVTWSLINFFLTLKTKSLFFLLTVSVIVKEGKKKSSLRMIKAPFSSCRF